MNNVKNNIASNLTRLRKEHNLTQSELALKLNYTDKSVSKWEHGESVPPIETLKELADLYDPFLMRDMSSAVERISQGIMNNEKIAVYGDYDADGVTPVIWD